jgi:hypothetical protein
MAGWPVLLLIGSLANRIPNGCLTTDRRLSGVRPWPASSQSFERSLWIRRWKQWLPDAGNALPLAASLQTPRAEEHRPTHHHRFTIRYGLSMFRNLPPDG